MTSGIAGNSLLAILVLVAGMGLAAEQRRCDVLLSDR
jgi:hypothetical protein